MLMFPKTRVDAFRHTNKALRYGQAFHQYMRLDKITGLDKAFCDRLYQADGEKAKAMIASRTDKEN
jgi:hypothetical protein